jgi:hypothetical protein
MTALEDRDKVLIKLLQKLFPLSKEGKILPEFVNSLIQIV